MCQADATGVRLRSQRANASRGPGGVPRRGAQERGPREGSKRSQRRGEVIERFLALLVIGLAAASPAKATDAGALQPGRYEVSVRLDLPNIEGAAASQLKSLCVPAEDGAGTHGLTALSENNP